MPRSLFFPLALLAATPAFAEAPAEPTGPETRVPRIWNFLEWVPNGHSGVFVRADTGRWYYARTQAPCSRLRTDTTITFLGNHGELDRFGAIRVEGWRCQLASVVETTAPAGHEHH